MGLDVRVYTNIRETPISQEDAECMEGFTYLYVNKYFEERADGIKDGVYSYQASDHFHAGSYSGYGLFRRELCMFVYGKSIEDFRNQEVNDPGGDPFSELLNFSDCEGIIGSITSAKLAEDFKTFQVVVDAKQDELDEGNYSFKNRYANFRRFFEMAASGSGGVVSFQ